MSFIVLHGVLVRLLHGLLDILDVVLHFLEIDVLLHAQLLVAPLALLCSLTGVAPLPLVEILPAVGGLLALLLGNRILEDRLIQMLVREVDLVHPRDSVS